MTAMCSGSLDPALGWAAGVVDARGYVRVHKGSIETRVRAVERELLDRLTAVLGGHVLGPYANGPLGKVPVFEWKLTADEARRVLPELLPLLGGELRRRVEEALHNDPAPHERLTARAAR